MGLEHLFKWVKVVTHFLPHGKSYFEVKSSKPFQDEWEVDVIFGIVKVEDEET